MSGHRHVGGTRGWKARRAACPVCSRDTACSPITTGEHAGRFMLVKRHGSPVCRGVGRKVLSSATRYPSEPR